MLFILYFIPRSIVQGQGKNISYMVMPVMNVRVMRMAVSDRLMHMVMGIWLGSIPLKIMLMLVMFVMFVVFGYGATIQLYLEILQDS